MAYLFLIVGVVGLFILSFMNIQLQEYEIAAAYGIPGVALIVFTAINHFGIRPMEEQRSRDKLFEWVSDNKNKIITNGATYQGEWITKETILIKYCIVYSAIIYTSKEYSNFCIKGSSRSYRIGIVSTIFNLILGWWGIPWGLIYTPQSIYNNLSRTNSITINEVITQNEQSRDVNLPSPSSSSKGVANSAGNLQPANSAGLS